MNANRFQLSKFFFSDIVVVCLAVVDSPPTAVFLPLTGSPSLFANPRYNVSVTSALGKTSVCF